MEPKKTALYETHKSLGGNMVEFAGYMMPVQYRSIIEEHKKVRSSVGIFDVSHMGEFVIKGRNSEAYLQKMTLNDVTKLVDYRAQYTGMCTENGGMVDDFILYRFPDYYLIVANASNIEKDFQWLEKNLEDGVQLTDVSDKTCLFAVQGRNAEATLQKIADLDLSTIRFFGFRTGRLAGLDVTFFRTGYTGEDGFEISCHPHEAVVVWNAIMEAGKKYDIEPIGLGARDTLRLEMTFCLYGNDIDETTNPIEAGLGWITKTGKGDFIGRDAILKVKETGVTRKLAGFDLKEKGVPRPGYKIVKEGHEVGHVTSGTFSPSLQKGIGLGYVNVPYHEVGTSISLAIRTKEVAAKIVKTPFYQRDY